ncbi:MAG TPA: hypothetical protein VNA17_06590 [Pyrinomonadaceae bacterium]|nr:hypothetical protein [Pyrinomonadaceae bacterium]
MRNQNYISIVIVLTVLMTVMMGCGMFRSADVSNGNNTAVNATSVNSNTEPKKAEKTGIVSVDETPDFSLQAEELTKAKKEGPDSITPPVKYQGKIIEVTGRVARLYPEKEKSLGPRVYLKGGRMVLDDVSCEFDEENKAEIAKLKVDQMVTLKGLVPERWLMFPSLTHCVIVTAK